MLKNLLLLLSGLVISTAVMALDIKGIRGERYCEILLGYHLHDLKKPLEVFNTFGLNNCPQALWSRIDPEKIKEEYQATDVKLNGPRIWVIDGMKNTTVVNPQIRVFQGLAAREVGVLELSLLYLIKRPQPYQTLTVNRNTTWVYDAGKPVYELLDPNDNIFIMQSFSLEKLPQTLDSLNGLANKLSLPKGWKFRTRILDKTYYLTPLNKQAEVIQDNFLNTYQKEV